MPMTARYLNVLNQGFTAHRPACTVTCYEQGNVHLPNFPTSAPEPWAEDVVQRTVRPSLMSRLKGSRKNDRIDRRPVSMSAWTAIPGRISTGLP